MRQSLNFILWTEAILGGAAVAAAFVGLWGVFAGLAFLAIYPVIWLIAIGILINAAGVEAVQEFVDRLEEGRNN